MSAGAGGEILGFLGDVPLMIVEPGSARVRNWFDSDSEIIVWTLTRVELLSAIARLRREGENQSVEFQRSMAEIKKDLQRYREVMRQLPTKVEEFSDEEIEKMTGKASQLLALAEEVTALHTHVRRQLRSCTSC